MVMQKANIDGVQIAYDRRGRGLPLVLVHGYPLDHSIWEPMAPFVEQQFDLIMPDLRGFGESEVMSADNSIVDYASDIAGLLTHLNIRKAYIAGHSMGGYVTLAFAREYPDRVLGLAMVASQLAADAPDRKEARYASAKQVLEQGAHTVAEQMAPKLSVVPRWQAFAHGLVEKQPPQGIAGALYAMAGRPDSGEMFAAFPFPVVIVHGEADELIPVQKGREMKAALPSAHYVELPGAGHLPMMEQPEKVAEALRFFQTVKVK